MFWSKKGVDFTEMFRQGEPVSFEGKTLWSSFSASANGGDRWLIRFRRYTTKPIQGLMIAAKTKGVRMEIAGRRGQQFVLWTDTAPEQVEIEVVAAPKDSELGFYNVWRDDKHGTMMYGVNAAALLVEEQENGSVVLHCSDGWKGPDFTDLVVHLERFPKPE